MSGALVAACLWGLAATLTAFLPMRWQFMPGLALLLLALPLLVWLGATHGIWVALLGFAGFLSMFRRPLWYLGRRALGRPLPPPRPKDQP